MRDIGESENEIPQELGRADRAMRQASKRIRKWQTRPSFKCTGKSSRNATKSYE